MVPLLIFVFAMTAHGLRDSPDSPATTHENRFQPPSRQGGSIPWVSDAWQQDVGYDKVVIEGNLTESGMSGELTVLNFFPKPVHRKLFRGRAVLKPFSAGEHEAYFTEQAAENNGLSVGLVGKCSRYLLTEYVDGKNLDEIINRDEDGKRKRYAGRGAPVQRVMAQLMFILDHLEGNSVIHRDIKPQNMVVSPPHCADLLLDGPEQAWIESGCILILLDYGLACSTPGSRKPHPCEPQNHSGTIYYSSPEMQTAWKEGLDLPHSSKMDVFGMGAVLFHLFVDDFPTLLLERRLLRQKQREKFEQHRLEPDDWEGADWDEFYALLEKKMRIATALNNPWLENTLWQGSSDDYGVWWDESGRNFVKAMLKNRPGSRPTGKVLWEGPYWDEGVKAQVQGLSDKRLQARSEQGLLPEVDKWERRSQDQKPKRRSAIMVSPVGA